jgi:hypothetical protein
LQQVIEEDPLEVVGQTAFGPAPLLPGEDVDPAHLEDADHWVAVYEELIGFLHQSRPDLPATVERYRRRLAYWRALRDQLEHLGLRGGGPEPSP